MFVESTNRFNEVHWGIVKYVEMIVRAVGFREITLEETPEEAKDSAF